MKLVTKDNVIIGCFTDGYICSEFEQAHTPPSDFDSSSIDGCYVTPAGTVVFPTKPQLVWTRIKAERDRRIQESGYKVGTKWFHSDTFSRTQQMGLVMLGANIPANTPWKTMDGSFVIMTQSLANQVFGTAAMSDIAIFSAAEVHRQASITNPVGYDYLSGWPQSYAESLV